MNLMPLVYANSGVWSGPGITGTSFNPAIAGSGSFILHYNTASIPSGLCPDQTTVAVNVYSLAPPAITKIGPFCNNNPSEQFIITPLGGNFNGINTSAVSTKGVFNPALAVIGGNVVNYFITQGPCIAYAQTTVMVERFVPADFITSGPAYCKTNQEINLYSLVQNIGGTWDGTGVKGNMFYPVDAEIGLNLITYRTYSYPTPTLCADTKTIFIRVDDIPKLKLPVKPIKGCVPFELTIDNPGSIGGIGVWNFGDGSDPKEDLGTSHIYTATGTYTITYNYNLGSCSTQSTLIYPVVVNEKPKADFVFSPEEITVSTNAVNLVNLTSNKEYNSYKWDIQNIGSSSEINPVINYEHPGKYQVTLYAYSLIGCSDEISKTIEVKNDFGVYFPNSFSPNGDGINDEFLPVFSPYGLNTFSYKMEIFDRWGHSLYVGNDVTKGWNGTIGNKGEEPVKEGVYAYVVRYKDLNGKVYEKIGNLSLLVK